MGETIEDMDKEIETKNNKINFLTDKIEISDEQIIQIMQKEE